MTFKTPARAQWPRDTVTGAQQDAIAPGSMAVNIADKKIYVGSMNGVPILFSQKIEDHSALLHYDPGDMVIFDAEIYRAKTTVPVGTAFSDTDFESISGGQSKGYFELNETGMISGGAVTINSGNTVSVATGKGLIVDNTSVVIVDAQVIEWGGFLAALNYQSEASSVVGINAFGALVHVAESVADRQFRRENIVLTSVLWDALGNIIGLVDNSIRVGGVSETVRDAYYAEGGAYRASGCALGFNPGTFELTISAGQIFNMGGKWRSDPLDPNVVDVPAINPLIFSRVSITGVQASNVIEIDNTVWDNGGTLTAIPAGQWTIQYIIAAADFSAVFVQYGQALYPTTFSAAEVIAQDWQNFIAIVAGASAVLLGAVITGPDDASLYQGRIIAAARGADPFVNSIAQNDEGFYVLDGARALTGPMDAGGNNINNAGVVTATEISTATIKSRANVWG